MQHCMIRKKEGRIMDLKYLEYIVEIGNERNISKASKKLFISQPTLSVYLSKLEEELGTCLFYRNKNELIPTEAGTLYINTAKEMLVKKESLYHKIAELTTKVSNQLSIGFFQNIAGNMISYVYPKFISIYPNMRVDIADARFQPIYEGLIHGIFQLAFIAVFLPDEKELHYEFIKKEEFILAVPKSHFINLDKNQIENLPEGELPCISINQVKDEPFILSTPETIRRKIENALFHYHHMYPKKYNEVHNVKTTINMIEEGFGVAIIPKGYIDKSRNISYYRLDFHPYWDIVAAYKKDSILSFEEKKFISLARDYYNKHDSYLN